MKKINLNKGKFIISKCKDHDIRKFLKEGVYNFFEELSQYITDNNDEGIIHYATERTMASLFVCGNLKRKPALTGVQEYGTFCTKNHKEVRGRPDIFMKDGAKAIWIECKYEKNIQQLGEDHWDIPGWLEWDSQNAFSQAEIYYNSEKEHLNNSYTKRYIVTLCFKLIKENRKEHEHRISDKLKSKIEENCSRIWYYQAGFFPELEKETNATGLEVFGTCSDNLV